MKYCTVCKKFASALGFEFLPLCIAAGHKFVDKSFDDIVREATENS